MFVVITAASSSPERGELNMERCAREMISNEQTIYQLLPLAPNLVCWGDDSGLIRQLPIGLGAARVAMVGLEPAFTNSVPSEQIPRRLP